MYLPCGIRVLALSFVPLSQSYALSPDASLTRSLQPRALPDAPNGYTPVFGSCPADRPAVRNADAGLSQQENAILQARRPLTVKAMQQLLADFAIADFDAQAFFSSNGGNQSNLPNIGLAFSGGGYRAMLTGGGAMKAFDSREPSNGSLAGLLQSATYVAGLSGGSWLVGSMYVNNFTTISALQASAGSQWELTQSIFEGPEQSDIQPLDAVDYYTTIFNQVQAKNNAHGNYFRTSITDYWGRALSFQLINATNGGPSYTWSSIAEMNDFTQGNQPYPIIVADERKPGQLLVDGNSTVFEITPYEFGSWDPSLYGFVPTRYLGSNFQNGRLPDSEQCVTGFDNAGFMMGTSSSLFTQFFLQINETNIPDPFKNTVANILKDVSAADDDISNWPNPFQGFHVGQNPSAGERTLDLVDGGSDLQNIPLTPLIQPVRGLDVIVAVDSSADTTYHWPNGTALVATYERSLNDSIANGTAFPAVPDQNTFVNLGLNQRPTFFGCNSSNTSSPTPLIVYMPNYPWVYDSNVSTFDPSYNTSERDAIIDNGYNVAIQGNSSAWRTCLGCALLQRSFERTKTVAPSACQDCYRQYCWDGSVNSTQPSGDYEPQLKSAAVDVQGAASSLKISGAFTSVVGLVSLYLYL